MRIVSRWTRYLAGALCAAALAAPAHADTLLDSGTPGGFLGYYGFDVYRKQSVAIAFTPDQDYSFDSVALWLMSNDNRPGATLQISLQTDLDGGDPTAPSGSTLESWSLATSAAGWTPVLETMESDLHPLLSAGTTYWIVATSNEFAFLDPVWAAGGSETPYYAGFLNAASGPDWQVGPSTGAPAAIVLATPVPEPATVALALLGAPLVLGAAKRRAKRRDAALA